MATVSTAVSTENSVSDKLIIDANAKVIADVRLAHRTDIGRMRTLTNNLLIQLEVEASSPELFEQLGELLIDSADENSNEYQVKREEHLTKQLA
jgi:hypothetical protein